MKTAIKLVLLLLCLSVLPASAAPKFPVFTGYVVDDAHKLNSETVNDLTSQLKAHQDITGQQVIVVTLLSLEGQEIEEYGYQLGRAWGVGQKGKDNGVLLIVAPQEHKTRIEVGYGLEGQLTDALCSAIITNTMLPAFRDGNYNEGVTNGTKAILGILGGGDAAKIVSSHGQNSHGISIFHLILFAYLFYIIFFRRRRSGLLAPMIFGSMLGRSGGGSGGFGGGFGGGGGGSFGGGGGSGSW